MYILHSTKCYDLQKKKLLSPTLVFREKASWRKEVESEISIERTNFPSLMLKNKNKQTRNFFELFIKDAIADDPGFV